MGFEIRESTGYDQHPLGSLTTTGANETSRVISPSGISVPLLQAFFLTQYYAPADVVWVPVGVTYIITTGITVTAAVVQLFRNGVAVGSATQGTATLPIQALGPNEIFVAFSPYPVFAPGLGDVWSVKVTTTSTAGVVNPVNLVYAKKAAIGITEGVTL